MPKFAEHRPIRAALVLYRDDLNVGGSLRVAELLANHFNQTEVEAHLVFAYGGPGPVAQSAKVPCHYLRAASSRDFAAWKRARRFFSSLDPDVVHFHNPAYWLHAALAGTRYKRLVHVHGPLQMGKTDQLLQRGMRYVADGFACITDELRRKFVVLGWGHPDRTWFVHNAIDCRSYREMPSRAEARWRLALPGDALILGMVCRLAPWKGCLDGVEVFSRLTAPWHLVFCGEGPMRTDITARARELGVSTRIHFTGMLSDVRLAYAAMDASLFCSHEEPFGLIIAESMAAERPVFGLGAEGGYRDPAYPLVLPDNAIFVDRCSHPGASYDPAWDILAARIDAFGHDRNSLTQTTRNALAWVTQRFDISVQASAVRDLYVQLLDRAAWEGGSGTYAEAGVPCR